MQLMAGPCSVQDFSLVWYDLIASHEAWDGRIFLNTSQSDLSISIFLQPLFHRCFQSKI